MEVDQKWCRAFWMNLHKEKLEEFQMQFKNQHIQVKLRNRRKFVLLHKNNNPKVKYNFNKLKQK